MKHNPFATPEPSARPTLKPVGPFKWTDLQIVVLDALAAEHPDVTRRPPAATGSRGKPLGRPEGNRSAVVRLALERWLEADPKAAQIARRALKAAAAGQNGQE